MSYILNALRKSEQERMARQADAITGRILASQARPKTTLRNGMILLLIANLVILAGLFWYLGNEAEPPTPAVPRKAPPPEKAAIHPAPAAEKIVEPVSKKAETPSPSLAEWVAGRKKPAAVAPVQKPAAEKKPVPAPLKPEPTAQMPDAPATAPETRVTRPLEPVERTGGKTEAASEHNTGTIPFLYELPVEFRRSVPDIKINVFVYSKQPAERFVIVDMAKYTVGQRIKEVLELKEIRPGSLVVEYNNQTFQIQRP